MSSSARFRAHAGNGAALLWQPVALDPAPRAPVEVAATPDPVAEAYSLGFSQGQTEGEGAERIRVAPAIRAAEEALQAINEADQRWTGAVEENVIALALAVARHIVDREVDGDQAIIERLVRRALDVFPVDHPVQVRVHPDDLTLIRALRDERAAAHYGRADETTLWVADARVTRGGCIVEGRNRIVDARIETALERIYRRLAHQHA